MVVETLGTAVPLSNPAKRILRRRFYSPLVFLKSLNEACSQNGRQRAPEAPPTPYLNEEQDFKTFVNKLAQICDSEPKGATVSAIYVLQESDGVKYLFASNRRTPSQLERTRQGLLSILEVLKRNILSEQKQSLDALRNDLLRLVLSMNFARLKSYLNTFTDSARECIAACDREATDCVDYDILAGIRDALQQLHTIVSQCSVSNTTSDKWFESITDLISALQHLRQSEINMVIQKRATEDRKHNVQCWSNLRHVVGRLISYQYVAEALITAHETWEELFLDFQVDFIPSSSLHPWLVKTNPETADAIIGRMAPEEELDTHRARAQQLQMCNLDGIIEQKWGGEGRPYVHAEILLLDWLENTGGVQPYRFFNNWQYIGSSKPTCRLCQYYFEATGTPVEVRPSHRNIYLAWRLPDIYEHQGDEGAKKWRGIMSYLKSRISKDALLLLEERVSDRRDHDSNTTSARFENNRIEEQPGVDEELSAVTGRLLVGRDLNVRSYIAMQVGNHGSSRTGKIRAEDGLEIV